MYCEKCGKALDPTAEFCGQCGKQLGISESVKKKDAEMQRKALPKKPINQTHELNTPTENEINIANGFRMLGIVVGVLMVLSGLLCILTGQGMEFGGDFNTMLFHAIHYGFGALLISFGLLAVAYFGSRTKGR